MQEWVLHGVVAAINAHDGCFSIGQIGVVFRMLGDPQARQRLQRFHRLAGQRLGVYRAEKTANFLLGRLKHGQEVISVPTARVVAGS